MLWKIGGGAAVACGAVWLSPIVCLNSAGWSQCDAIYSCFSLLAVLMLDKKRYNTSLCFLGIGLAFKLQAIFILPLFIFVWFVRKEFSVLRFAFVPICMVITGLPAFIFGRSPLEIFSIYAGQEEIYPLMSMNYPSIWVILCKNGDGLPYEYMKLPAIAMTAGVLAVLMFWWIIKRCKPEGKNLYIIAFLVVYTCVLFLPSMHERYGYLYEVMSILLAVMIPRMIIPCIGLLGISLNTYGKLYPR